MTYEEIIRGAVGHDLIADAKGRGEGWLRQRLNEHRHPGEPLLQRRSDGRWLQISERRTEAGGTVAIYSDLTAVKESEQRAAAANQLIVQSLRYASRIQSAILPARRDLDEVAADHFLIWEPRDIVGGDFFWFQPIEDGYAVMVGDCTGHGVPGAFMTLIAWGLLDRMLRTASSDKPSEVLKGLHRGVQSLLGQNEEGGETDDGLEAGICFIKPAQARDQLCRRAVLAVAGQPERRHRDQGRSQGTGLPPLSARNVPTPITPSRSTTAILSTSPPTA